MAGGRPQTKAKRWENEVSQDTADSGAGDVARAERGAERAGTSWAGPR